MRKVVLLVMCTVCYLSACESSNNTTNKIAKGKMANETAAKGEIAKNLNEAQWAIDHPKMLAFIKQHKMDAKWLPSGLYYSIVQTGSGAKPTMNSVVNVSYEMSDLNGNQIWSTIQSDGKETRSLNQFPAGVSEGLQLIQAGGRIQLIVPSGLAYGDKGWGKQIASNTNLFYDIQLNSVE